VAASPPPCFVACRSPSEGRRNGQAKAPGRARHAGTPRGYGDTAASSRCACAAQARTRTRTWPSTSSAVPITTAVCDPLCGSTPIITAAIGCPFLSGYGGGIPWRACLIPDRSAVAPLLSHATAGSGGLAHRYKARPQRSAGGSGASPSDPSNATTNAATLSGTIRRECARQRRRYGWPRKDPPGPGWCRSSVSSGRRAAARQPGRP
jgi:hypothetical protein